MDEVAYEKLDKVRMDGNFKLVGSKIMIGLLEMASSHNVDGD